MKEDIKVLLCSAVRLENQYVEEWVRYYQKIGVDKIVFYDNNLTNGERITDVPYIRQLADEGYIDVWVQPDKRGMQTAQFTECYNIYYKDYDWMTFLDIDEFLMFRDYDNIKDYLSQERFDAYDMIHLQWVTFDDNNIIRVKDNDYSMVKRFTHPIDVERLLGSELKNNSYGYCYNKTILRGRNFMGVRFTSGNSHTPTEFTNKNNVLCCDSNGNPTDAFLMAHPFLKEKEAWVNHYICKTIEEYMTNKMVRCCGSLASEAAEKTRVNLRLFLKYNTLTFDKLKYINDFDPELCQELLDFVTTCCARYAHNMDMSMMKIEREKKTIKPVIKRLAYSHD